MTPDDSSYRLSRPAGRDDTLLSVVLEVTIRREAVAIASPADGIALELTRLDAKSRQTQSLLGYRIVLVVRPLEPTYGTEKDNPSGCCNRGCACRSHRPCLRNGSFSSAASTMPPRALDDNDRQCDYRHHKIMRHSMIVHPCNTLSRIDLEDSEQSRDMEISCATNKVSKASKGSADPN